MINQMPHLDQHLSRIRHHLATTRHSWTSSDLKSGFERIHKQQSSIIMAMMISFNPATSRRTALQVDRLRVTLGLLRTRGQQFTLDAYCNLNDENSIWRTWDLD